MVVILKKSGDSFQGLTLKAFIYTAQSERWDAAHLLSQGHIFPILAFEGQVAYRAFLGLIFMPLAMAEEISWETQKAWDSLIQSRVNAVRKKI